MEDQKRKKIDKDSPDGPQYFWGLGGFNFIKARDRRIYEPIANRPENYDIDGNPQPLRVKVARDFFDWVMAISGWVISVLTLGIIGAYTYYAGGQLIEMRRAADASAQASCTAAQALKDNESSFSQTLSQMKAQSKAMHDAAVATKSQADTSSGQLHKMKSSRLPWAGLDSNSITIEQPFWGQPPHHTLFYFSPVPGRMTTDGIYVTTSYSIKNFGVSPALHEEDALMALPDNGESIPPTDHINQPCERAEALSMQVGAANPGAGAIILPGESVPVMQSTNLRLAANQEKIENIWIFLCVVYTDDENMVHHSKYWYRSYMKNPPTYLPLNENPALRYVPLAGASLWGANAD